MADEGIADRREACLNTPWLRPRGVELPVRAACIDTGGQHTSAVYSFVKPCEGRRVFAIKGVGGEDRALVGRPSKNNVGKVRLFPVGFDTAKELIYARLKDQGAGTWLLSLPGAIRRRIFSTTYCGENCYPLLEGLSKTGMEKGKGAE